MSLIEEEVGKYQTKMQNATVKVTGFDPLTYTIEPEIGGQEFALEQALGLAMQQWSNLQVATVTLTPSTVNPEIVVRDVESVIDQLPRIFAHDAVRLTHTDPHTKKVSEWKITSGNVAAWLEVQEDEDGKLGFGLNYASTTEFLEEEVAPAITIEAQNARFSLTTEKKVMEFQESRPGVGLDIENSYVELNDAIWVRNWEATNSPVVVPLVVENVEPEITTSEVNNLGITEVLGVGYSTFTGSPGNRIKNIRHAVYDKLNGLLVKPGEEFSMLAALKPFTIAGGYLPELVIKGDRIKPEIGGGLCQIGSTMFRAAMNSGLPITARQNHSLVVHYYNDPRNGNPGTDATIYDPAPDFRFLNDTGNYILIATSMNETNGDIFFTLWGTSDGRKGYYTEPKVLSWTPSGPTKMIETTELPVGKTECQLKHDGAVATFNYIRELPDGEKIVREFKSHYRALPRICLIGVEAKPEEAVTDVELDPNGDFPADALQTDVEEPTTDEESGGEQVLEEEV